MLPFVQRIESQSCVHPSCVDYYSSFVEAPLRKDPQWIVESFKWCRRGMQSFVLEHQNKSFVFAIVFSYYTLLAIAYTCVFALIALTIHFLRHLYLSVFSLANFLSYNSHHLLHEVVKESVCDLCGHCIPHWLYATSCVED